MSSAASEWPRPPRRVRARAAFATWRPFGMAVMLMLAACLVVVATTWGDDDFRSPRGDWHLDAASGDSALVGAAVGSVTRIDRNRRKRNQPAHWARYHFTFTDAAGVAHTDHCWARNGAMHVGDHHGVEYLNADPSTCRLLGTQRAHFNLWLPQFLGFALLPLLCALLLWLARVHRTWVVLRDGRAAAATLVERRAPEKKRFRRRHRPTCRVRYRYRGNDGLDHEAVQSPLQDSALGRAVLAAEIGGVIAGAFAAYSEFAPQKSRLCALEDVAEDAQ